MSENGDHIFVGKVRRVLNLRSYSASDQQKRPSSVKDLRVLGVAACLLRMRHVHAKMPPGRSKFAGRPPFPSTKGLPEKRI